MCEFEPFCEGLAEVLNACLMSQSIDVSRLKGSVVQLRDRLQHRICNSLTMLLFSRFLLQ